ncbi:MAG: hypothetical protein AAGA23_03910 [Pseudomonadota bacterium]
MNSVMLTAGVLVLYPILNGPAMAQSTTVTREAENRQATIERDQNQENGSTSGSATLTVGERTAERAYDRSFDAETGTYTVTRSTSTGNGAAVTSSATVDCSGAGTCTRDSSYVGPRGGAGGSASVVSRASDGTVVGTTAADRPNGETVIRNRVSTGTPGARNGEVVQTGPQGQTTRRFARDGRNSSTSTNGPQGRTRAVERRRQRSPGQVNVETRVTSPRGQARERRRWVRVDREKDKS